MYKILEKTQFSEKVFKFRIEAPAIAKHAHAGQFLMVRANETGERVPFTLAGWNGDEGWVEFIFMVIGKTTEMLSTYEAGESLRDVVGPLGVPTEMAEGPCAVIGGGVGLAIAFPVAKHLVDRFTRRAVIVAKDLVSERSYSLSARTSRISSASFCPTTTSTSPPTTAPTASRALSPLRWSACCRTRP